MKQSQEAAEAQLKRIFSDPVLFCELILNVDFTGREYQKKILRSMSLRKALRMGRRMGKSTTMAMWAIWYAVTHPNERVIFMSPYMSQIDNIWREMSNLIEKSDIVKAQFVKGKVKTKPYMVDFVHGARISGFSANVKGGGGATNLRGQGAQAILLDEADYLDDESIETISALLIDSPNVILWAGSTISDQRGPFYRWCHEGIKNNEMQERWDAVEAGVPGALLIPGDRPTTVRDWTEFYLPSTESPNWTPELAAELRLTMSEDGWRREIMVEFGDETQGVFKGKYLTKILQSPRSDYNYTDIDPKDPKALPKGTSIAIGVDWDKYQAGPNICVTAKIGRRYQVIHREEIPRGEYTLQEAVRRIIGLNDKYNPKYIYVDRGYGESQYEQLRYYGKKHPETKLVEKVKGIAFQGVVPVKDVLTGKVENKKFKHFMINTTQKYLEEGLLLFSRDDEVLYKQMNEYMVVRHSLAGEPIYSSGNEHALDAFMLTLLAFRLEEDNDDIAIHTEETKPLHVEAVVETPLIGVVRRGGEHTPAVFASRDGHHAPVKRKTVGFQYKN